MTGEKTVHTHSVHTMPLDELRSRAREARRLLARAREIARVSFDNHDGGRPSIADASEGGGDAAHRVGLLFDAAQRLLPGMAPFADERAPASRMKRIDTSWRRVTLRGGTERALEAIERAEILEMLLEDAEGLVAEIGRRSSSVQRTAEAAPASTKERATRRL